MPGAVRVDRAAAPASVGAAVRCGAARGGREAEGVGVAGLYLCGGWEG